MHCIYVVVLLFKYFYQLTLLIVFLSTQPSPFSSRQLDLEKWRLMYSRKRKIRVSRQPSKGCPNTRKCFTLRLFTLFTSVLLTAILLTPRARTSGTYQQAARLTSYSHDLLNNANLALRMPDCRKHKQFSAELRR